MKKCIALCICLWHGHVSAFFWPNFKNGLRSFWQTTVQKAQESPQLVAGFFVATISAAIGLGACFYKKNKKGNDGYAAMNTSNWEKLLSGFSAKKEEKPSSCSITDLSLRVNPLSLEKKKDLIKLSGVAQDIPSKDFSKKDIFNLDFDENNIQFYKLTPIPQEGAGAFRDFFEPKYNFSKNGPFTSKIEEQKSIHHNFLYVFPKQAERDYECFNRRFDCFSLPLELAFDVAKQEIYPDQNEKAVLEIIPKGGGAVYKMPVVFGRTRQEAKENLRTILGKKNSEGVLVIDFICEDTKEKLKQLLKD